MVFLDFLGKKFWDHCHLTLLSHLHAVSDEQRHYDGTCDRTFRQDMQLPYESITLSYVMDTSLPHGDETMKSLAGDAVRLLVGRCLLLD